MKDRMFDFYKKDLLRLHREHGRLRMITIEYVCRAPKIDPYEMGRSLIGDGCRIVFDDSTISKEENNRKYRRLYGV